MSSPLFLSFLAGFVDAEGSIYFHRKGSGGSFEITITNTDVALLEEFRDEIKRIGHHAVVQLKEQKPDRLGFESFGEFARLCIWRHKDVVLLLRQLSLRHGEKIAKLDISLAFMETTDRKVRYSILGRWNDLISEIHRSRDAFVMEAERLYLANH